MRFRDWGWSHTGWFLTGVWTLLATAYLTFGFGWGCFVALPPNEMGDSLAGFAAPLAALWLVVGYKQQSRQFKTQADAILDQDRAQRRNEFLRYAEMMSLHQVQLAANLLNVTSNEGETNMAWHRFSQGDRDAIYGSIIEHGFRAKPVVVTGEMQNNELHRRRAVNYIENFETLLRRCRETEEEDDHALREFFERSMMGSVYAGLCLILKHPMAFSFRPAPVMLGEII